MTGGQSGLDLAGLRARVASSVSPTLTKASQLGFLGSAPIEVQIDHSLGFVFCAETALGQAPRSVLDLGSGGGLPGLVLSSCWPDARIVLVDSNERRTAFLKSVVEDRVTGAGSEVVRARAEELGRDESLRCAFELVTARSFGSPAVVAECGAPFLCLDGMMVVSEPPVEPKEIRWPEDGLAQLGLSTRETLRFDGRFGFKLLTKVYPTPGRFPRRVGIPAKRPLF
jgi:16S rRNA (guanine527-N7)-methyltransferase